MCWDPSYGYLVVLSQFVDRQHCVKGSFRLYLGVVKSHNCTLAVMSQFMTTFLFLISAKKLQLETQSHCCQTVRTAAMDLLIKEIDTWIMELRTYAIKFRTSPRFKFFNHQRKHFVFSQIIIFSKNLAKIQVGPKYTLAPPPKFQVGTWPLGHSLFLH